jgi:dynein heavy chain
LPYEILDVKQTQWHDDYGQLFKENVKNLEMNFQNIITLAFKNISTVQDAVELLENFDTLAKRPFVRDFVHNKAASTMVFKLFQQEIQEVNETFESKAKKPIPMPFSHPYYAGQAIWAYSLIVRLDKARSAIRNLYFVAETPVQKEALDKYNKLRETLDQFIEGTCYKTWEQEIANMDSNAIDGKLDMCILTWSENSNNELPQSMNHPLFTKKKSGLLESNFDSELHKVISEGTYWQKIMALGIISLSYNVNKLLQKKESLRVLRENVMLIVRDYNNIKMTINEDETKLF